jgi:hypothetical protein
MPHKMIHGFAWYTFPDRFGLEEEDDADPGHPFSSCPGQVLTPAEVVYYRPAHATDAGVRNQHRSHSYLVLTRTQLHPKVCHGWESEPAALTDNFKSDDAKLRMVRIIQNIRTRQGEILECEMKLDEG